MSDRQEESVGDYLQRTSVPELFQALTVSLLREQPSKPVEYLRECLHTIASNRKRPVLWDSLLKTTCNAQGSLMMEDSNANWRQILTGKADKLPPLPSNIVRIFLSSTFSDFKAERTVLPRHAYPKLREFCSRRGLDFQVVDMRWGVTDEMVNDHMTSAICLREINLCQELSQGPCFVAMLGHRYGYQPLPPSIGADEFRMLYDLSLELKLPGVKVVQEWYIRDDNAIPPVYCLQPITDKLPDYKNYAEPQLQLEAKQTWGQVYRHIRSTLRHSSEVARTRGLITEERHRSYFMSVTEEEVGQGILFTSQYQEYALCYVRELDGIKNVPFTNKIVTQYLDIVEEHVLDEVAQSLLSELVHEKIPPKLTEDHLKEYHTRWTGIPLDSTKDDEHKCYLERFCADFVRDVQTMISQKFTRSSVNIPQHIRTIYLEALLHSKFGLKKCEVFCGQESVLGCIQIYLNRLNEAHFPLVIHGKSGYGKTSLLANVGKCAKTWLPSLEAVVVRFLGTTPDSSSIKSTLLSVTKQLSVIFSLSLTCLDGLEMMSDIRKQFVNVLETISEKLEKGRHVLILLDSVDQLSTHFGGHQMHWLPRMLPSNIGIVLSMLNDRYSCYDAARERLQDDDSFVELTELPITTGTDIVSKYLKHHSRTVTIDQHSLIMETFRCCKMPLFLKLILDEARQWNSYLMPSQLEKVTSIQEAINHFFQLIEDKFGSVFVRATLGYLTCGKDGLTGLEMEDVLSCDNDVLSALYVFHDPPLSDVIRVPPLLWARLQNEIKEYIVERRADGKSVMAWYHRLFWETAADRYVNNSELKLRLHSNLATIFRSEGSVKKTIVLEKRNKLVMTDADRQVSPQPLTATNVRKLNALPYHLYLSEQFDELKYSCLLDFNWVFTKLQAVSVRDVTNEFDKYCATSPFSDDSTVCLIKDFLHLAYEPLKEDPLQLAYQVLERLTPLTDRFTSLKAFVDGARLWTLSTNTPLLLPVNTTNLRSPESALVYSALAGNSGVIHRDGEIAGCGFLDKVSGTFKIQIWNLKSKDLVESIPSKMSDRFVISGDSRILAVVNETTVKVFETCSGDLTKSVRYRREHFDKCYLKSVCIDEIGNNLLICAKVGDKKKGSGFRYRSDIYRVKLNEAMDVQRVEYSQPGARALENIILTPDQQRFVVTDFETIVLYDLKSLGVIQTITDYPVVNADTFCFPDCSDLLFGAVGGYNEVQSKLVAIDLETRFVDVSETVFVPSRYIDGVVVDTSNMSSDCDDELPFFSTLARVFAMEVNSLGTRVLAGLSSVGLDRQNCVAIWDRLNKEIKRFELPEREERFPKCLTVLPDWALCIVGWDDGLMMFVDVVEMRLVWKIKGHEMSLNVLHVTVALNQLVSIGTDRNLKVWDLNLLKKEIIKSKDVTDKIREDILCLDENQQVVDWACTNSMVVTALPYPTSPPIAWETQTARPYPRINELLQLKYDELYPVKRTARQDASLTFIKDGRYLVDIRRRRAEALAIVLDLECGDVASQFKTHNPFLFVNDEYLVGCTLGKLVVRRLPLGDGCQIVNMSKWPKELTKDHINNPPQILLTIDSKYILFVNFTGEDKYLEIVNVKTFTVMCRTDISDPIACEASLSNGLCYLILCNDLWASICSPQQLAARGNDGVTYKSALNCNKLSPLGTYGVQLNASSNSFTVWTVDTVSAVFCVNDLPQKIYCVCFSPSERYLLTGSYTVISVWSVDRGHRLHAIHTYSSVCDLSFTPNGRHVLIHCYAAPKRKRLIICNALRMD